MSTPVRPAMRLLSSRLPHLHRVPLRLRVPSYIRHASRYSNPDPSRRASSTAPTAAPSFLDTSASLPISPARNPLDARAVQLAAKEKRQYHLNRMRFAGIGLILSIVGLAATIWNLDLDDMDQSQKRSAAESSPANPKSQAIRLDSGDSTTQFQGRDVHIIGAGEGKRIVAESPNGYGADLELVETGTSSVPHFPRTIFLPASPSPKSRTSAANPSNASDHEEYTLLGLGIRTVSFLSIQVYVAGMYVRTSDISDLQASLIHAINPSASTLVPAEKADLKARLLDPDQSAELWSQLLQTPGLKTAWRIAPTRNTDFMHLRDGWVTGINKRTAATKQALRASNPAAESEYDSESFGLAMKGFMSVFAGGKAPKGSVMVLARDREGGLDVYFQPQPAQGEESKGPGEVKLLGRVGDERIGRLIWMNYLGGKGVSSEAARRGVVEGCVGFAERPVGSVETRVV